MSLVGKRGTRGVLLITAGLIGSLLYVDSAVGVARFGDVEPMRFYTEPVQWMVDNDITTGISPTCFSPGDPVTRGQAAAFMWRMEGFPPPGAAHPFSDVMAPWQQDPVSWMFNNMITTGTTATTYSPDDNLTRGQLAALLHRLEGSPAAPPPAQFPDVVKSWQITPVGWMLANNITTGTSPTTFSPEDTVTRGQLAAFFYRYKGSPAVVVDPHSPACGTPTNPGDVKNCSDFDSQEAAQSYYDYYSPFYGDVANLDSDGDGDACESLPSTTSSTTSTSTTSTSTTSTSTTSTTTSTTTTTTTTLPPPSYTLIYVSFLDTTVVPGISVMVQDVDIVVYDTDTGTWSMYFDASDVAITNGELKAFHVRADGSVLMSFSTDGFSVPGMTDGPDLADPTLVDDSDVFLFTPDPGGTGDDTAGTFSFHFDGSDVGLDVASEDINALFEFPDGSLGISTQGNIDTGTVSGVDEDVHRFTGTFGAVTAGTWALYFDGSDVGLTAAADDLGAITFDGADMLFSTFGTNTTPGSDNEDINRFSGSFGSSTSGTATLELDLSTLGIDPLANVNGVHV